MASTLKLLGSEATLSTTASNVGRAKLVRVLNTDTTARLVTVKSGSNTIGTITLAPSEVQNIMIVNIKQKEEKINFRKNISKLKYEIRNSRCFTKK